MFSHDLLMGDIYIWWTLLKTMQSGSCKRKLFLIGEACRSACFHLWDYNYNNIELQGLILLTGLLTSFGLKENPG